MKLNKILAKILVVAAVVTSAATSVMAQGDFDSYALDKTIVIPITVSAVAGNSSNNTVWCDVGEGKWVGSGYIDIFVSTNWTTNTCSITPQTSPDQTNITALANFALSSSTTTVYTNVWYSGSTTGALLATNFDSFPFIVTTPNAALAGFATAYPLPQPFTNASPIAPVLNGPTGSTNFTRIGIQNLADLPRYLRLGIQSSGTNEIFATLHGRRKQ